VLKSNRELSFTRSVDLPPNAPGGLYDVDLRADDGAFILTDGCEFLVAD
jgi:hypothetical protein